MSIYTTARPEPEYRKRLGYQSMLLAGICCLVSVLIIFGNLSTKEAITEALKMDQLTTLAQVIPADIHDNDLLQDQITLSIIDATGTAPDTQFFVASQNQQPVAVAFAITGNGYSGDINLIMGVTMEGEVLGVRVVSHAETPGLGDKIEIAKDSWITAFDGLSLANTDAHRWAVKKDGGQFDQFTGATITPRAVVNAVYGGLNTLKDNRAAIVQAATDDGHTALSDGE